MKKTLSIILILVVALTAVPLTGCGSQGFTVMSVGELLESEDKELIELSENLSEIEKCDKEDLVCILDGSFNDDTRLPTGVDDNPIVYLTAKESFFNTKATTLTVPKKVNCIENVFPDDSGTNNSLKSVTVSSGARINNSFCNCSALEDVDLSDADRIRDSFKNCSALKSVKFPKTEVIKSSFTNCDALEGISVAGVKRIAESFTECPALSSIIDPDELEVIEDSFINCPKLGTIKMMSEIIKVDGSFSKCPLINTTEFISKASIVSNSFDNCENLQAVVLEGVSRIECPFKNCNALKTLSCTFEVCRRIKGGYTYDDESNKIDYSDYRRYGLVIHNSFSGLKGMTSANVAGKIDEIDNSFNNLPKFNTFKYNSLEKISSSFQNCPKLKNEVLNDTDREKRQKEEEKQKKKEEFENESYGPGQSRIKFVVTGSKRATLTMFKLNKEKEFVITADPGESVTKSFPSGRYVLMVNNEKVLPTYSNILKFESGVGYKVEDTDKTVFKSIFNPLNRL